MREIDPRSSSDLIDQGKLLNGRMRRRIAESKERVGRTSHRWEHIALGRVCSICRITQTPTEFDDTVACEPKAS